MSRLTHLLVLTPDQRDEGILTSLALELLGDSLGRPGETTGTVGAIRELNQHLGGFKNTNGNIWGGVLNHADRKAILDHLAKQPWHTPEAVQVLIREEEEASYRLYMFRNNIWHQWSPEPADW